MGNGKAVVRGVFLVMALLIPVMVQAQPGPPGGEPPAPLRFEDNGDGTITDNQTGLMWEKKDDAGGIHDKDTQYTWSTGTVPDGTMFTEFLPELNDNIHDTVTDDPNQVSFAGGYTDWRIPTIVELQTIIDTSVVGCGSGAPCVDPIFNTGCTASCASTSCSCTAASHYWSATTSAGFPNNAWFVIFDFGSFSSGIKSLNFHVRAVRTGP